MELGVGRAPGPGWSQEAGCAVCGSKGDCNHWPEVTSVFIDWKKGKPVPPKGNPIYADRRIFEDERLVYAPGDIVPHDHAVRLGLIDPPTSAAAADPERERKPEPVTTEEKTAARADARARRQTADRQTVAPEDRSA